MNILQVVYDDHILFYIKSENSFDTLYDVSLNIYYCNCQDRVFTCKYVLGVQRIVKECLEV